MQDKFIIFVIPTYNEKLNIPSLLTGLAKLNLLNWQVMIIDDNSPDGTGQLADKLTSTYPLIVIHRPSKNGLGSAYRDGFAKALDKNPDLIIQMDADLSHDPSSITQMLKDIKDSDLVIGSRYISGGQTKNWSWFRETISRFANFMARCIMHSQIHDLTSGFKIFRAEVLKNIPFEQTSSMGYNFQIEMNIICERMGYKIHETPITFLERQSGKSKFNIKIILESALRMLSISKRYKHEKMVQK